MVSKCRCTLNSDLVAESIGNLKGRFTLCMQYVGCIWKANKLDRPLKRLVSPILSTTLKSQSFSLKYVFTENANMMEKVVSELQNLDAKK